MVRMLLLRFVTLFPTLYSKRLQASRQSNSLPISTSGHFQAHHKFAVAC